MRHCCAAVTRTRCKNSMHMRRWLWGRYAGAGKRLVIVWSNVPPASNWLVKAEYNSLYVTTFLQQQNGRGRTDHMSNDCLLAPLQPGCLSTQLCMDIPAYTGYQEINYLSSTSAIYSQHLYRRSFKKQSSTTVPIGRWKPVNFGSVVSY